MPRVACDGGSGDQTDDAGLRLQEVRLEAVDDDRAER